MADNATRIATLQAILDAGASGVSVGGESVTYDLAEQLNREAGFDRIPRTILTKPPSAELKPNQVDQDKRPPDNMLDEILARYVEADETGEEIVADGFAPEVVSRVLRMVDAAEYKRRQAAPVLKVTARAFGTGRRMPIAQRFRPT